MDTSPENAGQKLYTWTEPYLVNQGSLVEVSFPNDHPVPDDPADHRDAERHKDEGEDQEAGSQADIFVVKTGQGVVEEQVGDVRGRCERHRVLKTCQSINQSLVNVMKNSWK